MSGGHRRTKSMADHSVLTARNSGGPFEPELISDKRVRQVAAGAKPRSSGSLAPGSVAGAKPCLTFRRGGSFLAGPVLARMEAVCALSVSRV
jgi:hypothetical protein